MAFGRLQGLGKGECPSRLTAIPPGSKHADREKALAWRRRTPSLSRFRRTGRTVNAGHRRVGNHVVPFVDRRLAGDDGTGAAMAVVDDLEDVATLLGRHGRQAPVVEDQELHACQALQQPCMASVTAGEGQRIEQARHAPVEHGAVVPAGFVAERTGEPALPRAGLARDQKILPPCDSLAGGELSEQRPVEAARRLGVEVLDRRILPEVGIFQARDQPFALALGGLAINERPEPLLEGEPFAVCSSLALCRQRIEAPDRKVERRSECDPRKIGHEQQGGSDMDRHEEHDRRDNGQPDQSNVYEPEIGAV